MPPRASGSPTPRTPGQLASHYAPRTPLLLFASRAELLAGVREGDALLTLGDVPPGAAAAALPDDPGAAAAALYDLLHRLDDSGGRRILAELPPDTPLWQAVRDRLTRAATPPGPAAETAPA